MTGRPISGRRSLLIALVAVGLQAGPLPPLHAAGTKLVITDPGITVAVESDLRLDQGVSPAAIQVATSQGVVTLSGRVNNAMARERARKIAEAVRGVLAVINEIVVTPVHRPDEAIRRDILTALLQDPATESYQIQVSVAKAAVTLAGSVGSWAESQLAAEVAREVSGIRVLTNNININYTAKRTDAEMAADIEARLQWDIWVAGDPINVRVDAGKAILTGEAGSVFEKFQADTDAWVNGILGVDDIGLRVNPEIGKKDLRRETFVSKSDDQIKQAVRAALRDDPRLAGAAPDVMVEDGEVILTGNVTHLRAESAAGQDAMNTVGVISVKDFLAIDPLMNLPDDADTQEALRAALGWDPVLAGSQITAAVLDHVAYLSGMADTPTEIVEAENVAARVKGVMEVRNHLTVESEPEYYFYNQPYYDFETFGPPPPKSDAQIKKAIERAFFWSPFVHRNDITVKVDGGVVTLTGTVGSWVGYDEACQDARKDGAVSLVLNKLHVKKGAWF